MRALLSLETIQSKFAAEWVLVGEPETDESLHLIRGQVLHHSKDRDEVYRKAIELQPRKFAVVYTGSIPSDTEIVL